MATLRHIRYSIKEALALYTEESNISNELIDYEIYIARLLLLSQKFSSRSFIIPQKLRQHFYCPLELSEENEFVDGLGTITRTVDPIQILFEPFNFKSNIRISSGSYTDTNFTLVLPDRLPYVGRSKWLQGQIYVTLGSDNRLYFISSNPKVKLIETVKLSMVCENPEEAYSASVDYNSSIDFEDIEYPLNGDLITILTDMIIKKLTLNLTVKEDKTNDATDNA